MKKGFLGLSLLLTPLAIYATPFNGFYAGAGIGGSQAHFDTQQRIEISPQVFGTQIFDIILSSNPDLTDQSFAGNIDVGFSHLFKQHFYLALEADANTQSLSTSNPMTINEVISPLVIAGKTQVQLTNEFAVTLNPGFVLGENTLFYGKIGPAWGDFDVKGSSSYSQNLGGLVTLSSATHFKQQGYEDGVRLGLGVERYISPQFSLKLEYLHTDYGTIRSDKQTFNSLSATTPVILSGFLSHSAKIDAADNAVMLGIHYHFTA